MHNLKKNQYCAELRVNIIILQLKSNYEHLRGFCQSQTLIAPFSNSIFTYSFLLFPPPMEYFYLIKTNVSLDLIIK